MTAVAAEVLLAPGPVADLIRRSLEAGIPEPFAAALVDVDADIAEGSEDRVTDAVERLTGHPPRSFAAFARARREERPST